MLVLKLIPEVYKFNMFKYLFKIFVVLIFVQSPLKSEEFSDILIGGNKRISNQTILLFADVTNEDFLNEDDINLILKKIYQSGFFKDVFVKIENKNLIINVVENPIIQSVFVEGVKNKKTKDLLYESLSLKNRSSFNEFSAINDQSIISKILKEDGYYFSNVTVSRKELGNNMVDLYYNIDLGNKAKIAKIRFIGDKKFKDRTLESILVSEVYQFWKVLSGKKYLNENLIEFDRRLLENFYKNKGFFAVKINSSFANYLGDDSFELIYNISAGKKYFFNDFKLNLPLDYDPNNFNILTSVFNKLQGERYSISSIEKILKIIDKITLNEQYEFLESTVTEMTKDNLINLVFNFEESEKFYIEKINIYGNNVTEESVIRNNLLIDEGDGFNNLLHNKGINNIKSLNFFKEVNSNVVKGTLENQKIININLEEKPTGEIMAGAGVGTDGGTFAVGVTENNYLGKGIGLDTNLQLSKSGINGIFTVSNPNYNGLNRTLDLSIESSISDYLSTYGYKSNKTGFLFSTGYERYEDFRINTGLSTYYEKLSTDSTASSNMKKQKGSYFDTFFNYTLDYDQRNQKFQTSDGYRSRFTQNIPLISENYSLTNKYDFTVYQQWLNENIASLAVYLSSTNSIDGSNVKLSERLYLPSRKLRGFESGKIGPKDSGDYIGGNYAMAINASMTLPQIIPNMQNSDFIIFLDAANVWGVDYSDTLDNGSQIRSSLGLGVNFNTPLGPLSFTLAQPITKAKTDITETFRFNIGTTF
tara:strand:+ start:998 stop:3277 length:2280 start_codon:yes stop_codon:yes gene_type:complete